MYSELVQRQKILWAPRTTSTNDVENFFSELKHIIGRDGRGLRRCSSSEVSNALKKVQFIIFSKLNESRGFKILPKKRKCYEDYLLPYTSNRHHKEKRQNPRNIREEAREGIVVHQPVRNYHRST